MAANIDKLRTDLQKSFGNDLDDHLLSECEYPLCLPRLTPHASFRREDMSDTQLERGGPLLQMGGDTVQPGSQPVRHRRPAGSQKPHPARPREGQRREEAHARKSHGPAV